MFQKSSDSELAFRQAHLCAISFRKGIFHIKARLSITKSVTIASGDISPFVLFSHVSVRLKCTLLKRTDAGRGSGRLGETDDNQHHRKWSAVLVKSRAHALTHQHLYRVCKATESRQQLASSFSLFFLVDFIRGKRKKQHLHWSSQACLRAFLIERHNLDLRDHFQCRNFEVK